MQCQVYADHPQGHGECPYPSQPHFPLGQPTTLVGLGMRVFPGCGTLRSKTGTVPRQAGMGGHPRFFICNKGNCMPPRAVVQNRSKHTGKARNHGARIVDLLHIKNSVCHGNPGMKKHEPARRNCHEEALRYIFLANKARYKMLCVVCFC